jgi:hypothetical protein
MIVDNPVRHWAIRHAHKHTSFSLRQSMQSLGEDQSPGIIRLIDLKDEVSRPNSYSSFNQIHLSILSIQG